MPQFFIEDLDHSLRKVGIYLIVLYLSSTLKYSMSFVSNVKSCENNVIQSTCNGAPSAEHVEGDQTATVGELGTDLASQCYTIMSEVNTCKLLTTKRQISMRLKRSRDDLARCSPPNIWSKPSNNLMKLILTTLNIKLP